MPHHEESTAILQRPLPALERIVLLSAMLGLCPGVTPAAAPPAAPVPGATDLLNSARASHGAGDYPAALALYMRALEEFRRIKDDADAAICLNNASVILLDQGEKARALDMADEAVRLRRGLGEIRLAGRSLTNRGRALQQLGRLREAESDFREAAEAARGAGEPRDVVVNELNLGVAAQARGLFGDALAAIRAAFGIIEENRGESWASGQRIIALNNRGALYEQIGEYHLALADYDQLLRLAGDGIDSVPYLINSATILRNLGGADLALEKLAQAERILVASGDDAALHANLLSNIGLVLHRNLGQREGARAVLERAREMAEKAGEGRETAIIGNELAGVYLDLGLSEEAARIYSRVLQSLSASSMLEPAWETHLGMARMFGARGDRQGSVRALRTAAALVEGARLNLAAEMAPRRFLADRLPVYAMLSSILADTGDQSGIKAGLMAVERARQRLLLSGGGRPHRQRAAMDDQDGRKEDLAALSSAAARLYAQGGGDADPAWQSLAQRWEERVTFDLPSPGGPDEASIEYLIAEDNSRVYWMSGGRVGTLRLPAEKAIERLCQQWLTGLTRGAGAGPDEPETGWRLHEAILLPVLEALPPGVRRLRVVPDGALWRIPLDALPVESPAGGPVPRLIERYEVTLSTLLSTRPSTRDSGGPGPARGDLSYAFFGPPPPRTVVPGDEPDSTLARLPALPEAGRELAAIRGALGAQGLCYLDDKARLEAFTRLSSRAVGIIHLATHAVTDPIDIGRTGILFAGDKGDDGFLSLPEILDLDFTIGLTFLSACSGAVGDKLPGEGLDSLAGALLESGSRAVVASLWDVEDVATRSLVEQFYHRVGRGSTFSSALREAKLALMNGAGGPISPRHWAGWVLIGDGDKAGPRPRARALLQATILVIAAALGAAAIYAAFRRRVTARS